MTERLPLAQTVVVLPVDSVGAAVVARELGATGATVVVVGSDAVILGELCSSVARAGGRASALIGRLDDAEVRSALVEMISELFAPPGAETG